ncbi:VWA domain-containing protein [Lederbergia panacisoli]|uniref:VWA domain-containing protein n=1 Tax=Lederbergia panacisoli TaxID=1255251 RepID=UPI00214AF051|nr:VWA domain-containing protein [Lederbergia panacisoli]MCR2820891.1 VWA domain-containing protein [Lederbergia panacisoli]
MELEFNYPFLLFLLIPAGVVLYLFFKQNKGFNNAEKIWIICMRSLVFALIILSLATPQLVFKTDEKNVVFLVDASASMIGTEDSILSWIEKSIQSKKEKDQFAVLTVGKNAAVEQSFQSNKEVVQEFASDINRYDTNIEQGIQLASSLFSRAANGRIVLFSDGNQTAGNILDATRLLKQRGIVLDYLPISSQYRQDMAVTEFTVPSALYEGEKVKLTMKIDSNYAANSTVRITLNDEEIIEENVEIKEGTNLFNFSHEANESGLYVYKAEIAAKGDTFAENNYLQAISNVTGTPRVLIVQTEQNEGVRQALHSSGLKIDQITPQQLPTTLSSYLRYQSILFNNIAATNIGEKKMKLINQAVRDFGIGFVMTGGENSFGLGGYFKTPIEELLPVEMEVKGKQELPSLGLIIVLDRSGSMEGEKLSLAKEAAARSVELLREKDTLGFIAFDDRPWEIIETTPINNKEEAIEKIRSVTVGGGTEIYPALEEAFKSLIPLKLQRKHIILLTDAQSTTNKDFHALIDSGRETNITLSTVALGQDADKRLLEDLAEYGSGRFYDVVDDTVIPSILSRETAVLTRTYIVDEPFYPTVHSGFDWDPLFSKGVPEMNAYIAVTPKSTSQIVLSSDKEDPILAEWQFGLGRTIAYTSDLSGKWAGNWARWEKWPDFMNHLISRTLPTYNSEPYAVHVETRNGQTVIQLQSSSNDLGPIETAVVSQSGEPVDASMKIIGPGKYELVMDHDPGMYFLRIKQYTEEGEGKLYKTGFTIPYSDELLIKGNNFALLNEASSITGGRQLINEKMAFDSLPKNPVKKQPISFLLIFIAFLLFFIEIAIRRFGLLPIRLFAKKYMKPSQKENKEIIVPKIKRSIKTDTLSSQTSPVTITSNKAGNKKDKPKKDDINKQSPQESMKRLLDAKRRSNR